MQTDDGAQTQQQTQSTQQASQDEVVLDEHLWGYLIPCSANLRRIDLQKIKATYRIGRNREEHKNDIILPGMKISNFHCTIEWDGDESAKSAVKVTDLSSNGTFINGEKIGKGKCKVLRDGNELAFGTCVPQPAAGGLEDYRFVFRHTACGPPSRGLYKYYDLQHELGKGSFATVMKALHKEEGKWYAVKMIQANKLRRGLSNASLNGVQSNDKANNFAREINILERLQHKNICQLKEVFFESYNINLVLEWVPGGDLLDYILRKGSLPEPEAQYLTYQICDALAYVHSQGIAHRDLKPENVLLTDDNPPVVKVADFGLAKVIDSMTMLRTMCGTPVYLAPEVVNQGPNNEGYDQVVDSWSVGVIVFSMLTMSTPFGEEDTNTDVKTRVSNRRVDWHVLREYCPNPDNSHAAEDFVRGLLEYDPRKRMSLADARLHPWLAEQHAAAVPAPAALPAPPGPAALPAPPRRTASPEPEHAIDASMRSIASDGMALDEPMDAEPAEPETGRRTPEYVPEDEDSQQSQPRANGALAISRQQSRLRRRVDIIRSAENRGEELPGPSQEMQERAAAEDAEENGAGPSRKRKAALDFDASLTPMEEEEEEEEEDEPQPTGRACDQAWPRREKASAPPSTAAKRGRGRAAAPVLAIAAAPANGDEGEAGGLRRSTRLHHASPVKQKVARRG
ncbi:kinase-like domain-containing protein [Cerioporus squamosus]|nr:kinase-like domain-containing protein [Cerioporus squamosus]